MEKWKTSSENLTSKWNMKNLILHALHAMLLVIAMLAHPVREPSSVGVLP